MVVELLVELELELELVVVIASVVVLLDDDVVGLVVLVLVFTVALNLGVVVAEDDLEPDLSDEEEDHTLHVVVGRFFVVVDSWSERDDLEREVVVMDELGSLLKVFVSVVETVASLSRCDEVVVMLVEEVNGNRLELEREVKLGLYTEVEEVVGRRESVVLGVVHVLVKKVVVVLSSRAVVVSAASAITAEMNGRRE